MLSIRLSRTGKKKQPYFRVIVVDKRRDPWGKAIEILGSFNPRNKETKLKEERIKYWLEQGAQPSNRVWNMLVEAKVVEGKKRGASHISKKRKARKEEAEKAPEEAKVESESPADEAQEPKTEEKPAEEKAE